MTRPRERGLRLQGINTLNIKKEKEGLKTGSGQFELNNPGAPRSCHEQVLEIPEEKLHLEQRHMNFKYTSGNADKPLTGVRVNLAIPKCVFARHVCVFFDTLLFPCVHVYRDAVRAICIHETINP